MTNFGKLQPDVAKFMAAKGQVVEIHEQGKTSYPNSPAFWVSTYGWQDYEANVHKRTCAIIVPDDVEMEEISYSVFTDTYAANNDELGLNAFGGDEGAPNEIRCSCGEYRGLTLRFVGELGDVIKFIGSL